MIKITNIHFNYSTNPPEIQGRKGRKIDENDEKSPEKAKKQAKVVVFLTI